jgi:hypothetical protein
VGLNTERRRKAFPSVLNKNPKATHELGWQALIWSHDNTVKVFRSQERTISTPEWYGGQ